MLIILFLKSAFRLYYLKDLIFLDTIRIGTNIYYKDSESNKNEGFIGFFDWLRKNETEIVGIRLCYFEHHRYNNLLERFSYVNFSNEGRWIELLFKNQPYDFDLSGDQDFTNNYVYESEGGGYLFTFSLDHLTEDELNSLKEYCEVITEEELNCH